jgi:hypothetical protein
LLEDKLFISNAVGGFVEQNLEGVGGMADFGGGGGMAKDGGGGGMAKDGGGGGGVIIVFE